MSLDFGIESPGRVNRILPESKTLIFLELKINHTSIPRASGLS